MCDYSLEHENSRPAKVGEKLRTQRFSLGTRGFASPDDGTIAVCVAPGTELAFAAPVRCHARGILIGWRPRVFNHATAIFRQVHKNNPYVHHDALEFPDGQMVRLTDLLEGQEATVLQLPAPLVLVGEAKGQERVPHPG